MFIWLKSFLYYVLRQEIDTKLTMNEIFVIDTLYSVLAIFIYAFIVIHSLTKSFELKRYVDPLYDVFSHSEALHLWISHTALYVGSMGLFSVISMANAVVPVEVATSRLIFYILLGVGLFCGTVGFGAIWLSNFTENSVFLRIMKLAIALFLLSTGNLLCV